MSVYSNKLQKASFATGNELGKFEAWFILLKYPLNCVLFVRASTYQSFQASTLKAEIISIVGKQTFG